MAGWLRSRAKLATILSVLKDQTSATFARASGPFSHLRAAIITATNHTESLPDELHVEQILAAGAGSRMQVSFCTRLLVKRLRKTHSWPVALKSLIILHRSLLDGGFLFQDLLSYTSLREGRGYLTFTGSQTSQDLEECVWVKHYARYLDERLRCAHALKTHLDNRWKGEVTHSRVEFMESGELLYQLEALQDLLHELCRCGYVGEKHVIQGALVLVVMDSYKVQEEVEFRVREMIGRVSSLSISESVAVLQRCKRAESQAQEVREFLEQCRELRLLSDIPVVREPVVSKVEIHKLTETIQELQKGELQKGVSFGRSASTGGKVLSGGGVPLQSTARKPFRIGGPGTLARTSSQPLTQLPRRAPGATNGSLSGEFPFVPEDQRHSTANLIDLSFDTVSSNVEKSRTPPQDTFRDLITF